ncbi:unnamed protein product [Schistosoma curassoni]|uniref:GD_AH_C domain-containing protein n=1 Tax=Schistosoma curassoni TaxID=6186 RepID=A0A183KB36_9TREM|nr:unnamed protein product [Schistosoma curassoni]
MVGTDNTGYEDTMGRHGLEERNENGERFANLPIDVGPPTIEEISMAIRQIKIGKAAGPDNIPAEALKADVVANSRIHHILFNKIWDEKQVPKD